MIREDLTEFRYYLEALSKFMQESYGISEQVKTFWSLLKQVDDYYDEYLRELDFFEVNRKPGETAWNIEGETLDKIGAIFGCQRKFTIPVYDTANMFDIIGYEQIDMNDDEFLVYVKTQVIKQNFDGTRETLQRLYSTFVDGKIQEGLIPQRFLYTTEYAPDGAICTIRWDEESPSPTLAKLFDNGYLTIESMGIRYRRQIVNFNALGYYAKSEYNLLTAPSAPSDWGDSEKYFSILEEGPAGSTWDPTKTYAKKNGDAYLVCPNEPVDWAEIYQAFVIIEITPAFPGEDYAPNAYYQYSDSSYSRYAITWLNRLSSEPADWSKGGYYKEVGTATAVWDDDKIYARQTGRKIIEHLPQSFLGMKSVLPGRMSKVIVDGFKGNSAIVNQLVQNGNFTSTSNWYMQNGTFSVSENVATFTQTNLSAYTRLTQTLANAPIPGHTYLLVFEVKHDYTESIPIQAVFGRDVEKTVPANSWYSYEALYVCNYASQYATISSKGGVLSTACNVQVRNVMLIDLTIVPLTPAEMTDVPTAKDALKHKGMDVDEYISYNAGTLTDSKPTKLISNPYNLCDGELRFGGYSDSGSWIGSQNIISNKNPIIVKGGVQYTFSQHNFTDATQKKIVQFDANGNFITSTYASSGTANQTITIAQNAHTVYLQFAKSSAYSSLPSDPQICFHLASANLGYKPHTKPGARVILPPEYQQVEYIQSSGTQYIDTGLVGDAGYEIHAELNFTALSTGNYQYFGGFCYTGPINRLYYIRINNSTNHLGYTYGSVNTDTTNLALIAANQWYDIDSLMNDKDQRMWLNGRLIGSSAYSLTGVDPTNPVNIYLFCSQYVSSSSAYCQVKAGRVRIFKDGNLVRDFVPCYKKSDNEVGMFDLVSGSFFANAGTGTFSKGDDCMETVYYLDMPTLKSAGSVQDYVNNTGDGAKGKHLTNKYTFTGQETWGYDSYNYSAYMTKADCVQCTYGYAEEPPNILCEKYVTKNTYFLRQSDDKIISSNQSPSTPRFFVKDTSLISEDSQLSTFKAAIAGVNVNYETNAPTDFVATMPKIIPVEEGGSIEVVGEGCDATVKIEWLQEGVVIYYAITAHQPTNWANAYSYYKIFELTDGSEAFSPSGCYEGEDVGGRYA